MPAARAPESHDHVDEIMRQWREMRPDLDPTPIGVLGRLHRAYLRYQTLANRLFERYGLNAASFDVLVTLRRAGPPYQMSARDLGAISMLSSAGVTLRLDRLEQAGLIVRERDREDRRVVHSRLTTQGFALIDRILAEHLANEREMLAGLSEHEVGQLSDLLRVLERSLEQADGAPAAGQSPDADG
jgi:DNA-binding MarR family transcriptional regulator